MEKNESKFPGSGSLLIFSFSLSFCASLLCTSDLPSLFRFRTGIDQAFEQVVSTIISIESHDDNFNEFHKHMKYDSTLIYFIQVRQLLVLPRAPFHSSPNESEEKSRLFVSLPDDFPLLPLLLLFLLLLLLLLLLVLVLLVLLLLLLLLLLLRQRKIVAGQVPRVMRCNFTSLRPRKIPSNSSRYSAKGFSSRFRWRTKSITCCEKKSRT